MLTFDRASIDDWLVGGVGSSETGLGEDALPTVVVRLDKMGQTLDAALSANPARLNERLRSPTTQTILRSIAHHLSAGSRLRILSWIVDAELINGLEILSGLMDPEAQPPGSGAAIRADVQHSHRTALLAVIFAPERIARVQAAYDRVA